MDVDTSGPLFDGRYERAVEDFRDEMKEEIGSQALADLHEELDHRIQNPTPYYETQVRGEREGADYRVHDSDVVYGPWLEGVGSRNATTRFKGYHHWRRTRQLIEGKAQGLAEHVLQRFLGRMQ